VNSSREPVLAVWASSQGMKRLPTTIISATNRLTLPRVQPRSSAMLCQLRVCSPNWMSAMIGSITSASTITRSSTMSQPMAMRPCRVSRFWRLSSARSSTTVLAVERARPNIRPATGSQPSREESPMPSRVATAIWAMAPGMAIRFTDIRSRKEKCSPTPNISRITPSSASSGTSFMSAT